MTAPPVLVIEKGCRTPCCDRLPVLGPSGRYVCRGCGTVYLSARRIIEDVFGPCQRIRTVGNTTFVFDVDPGT